MWSERLVFAPIVYNKIIVLLTDFVKGVLTGWQFCYKNRLKLLDTHYLSALS